jgi:hypothetical protein
MWGIILKLLGLLGKVTYIFRPGEIKWKTGGGSIFISGNVMTIRHEATFDRGLFLWFVEKGKLEISLQGGLNLASDIIFRNATLEANYHGVGPMGFVCNLRQLEGVPIQNWKAGQSITIEVAGACETSSFLEFPGGKDGVRNSDGQLAKTTFTVRKGRQYSDITIRNYQWRRTLSQGEVTIHLSKNHSIQDNTLIDFIETDTSSIDAAHANRTLDGKYSPGDSTARRLSSKGIEVAIPLSFETANDEYQITFHEPIG